MSQLNQLSESCPAGKAGIEIIPVTDPVLRLIVLSQLAADSNEPRPGALDGSDSVSGINDAIARIRALPFAELVHLAEVVRSPSIQIRVDLHQLSCDVNRYDHLQASTAMYKYFIRAEASVAQMIELFKTTSTAVKISQASMGVTTKVGRRAAPNDDTRLAIVDEWQRICDRHPFPRDRYYSLHRRFPTFTMAQLYGAINSWLAENNPRDKRGGVAP